MDNLGLWPARPHPRIRWRITTATMIMIVIIAISTTNIITIMIHIITIMARLTANTTGMIAWEANCHHNLCPTGKKPTEWIPIEFPQRC